MDWMSILQQVFELCIVPLLGLATTYLIKYLNSKSKETSAKIDNELASKYVQMLFDTVSTCVQATNQTYVDSLKQSDSFDILAQKEAFSKTKDAVVSVLTDEAKTYLTSFYGDLDKVIENLIESKVSESK